MRHLRLIGALLAGFALLFAPTVGAFAAGADGPTDVVITKMKLNDLTGWPKGSVNGQPITGADGTKYDGGKITDPSAFFGTGSEPLPGIKFTYFTVTKTQYETMKATPANYQTVAQVAAVVGNNGTQTAATDANGQVKIPSLANGYYWFVESDTGSNLVNGGAAVPFGLQLPVIKADGSYFGTGTGNELYVYPKNTVGNKPTVDKDITTLGNDSDSANVGDKVTWLIEPTLPADIASYKALSFTDNIDTRLNYEGNVVVKNGATTMVKGTDYTVTEPAVGTAGGKLVITFTDTGIAKLTPGVTTGPNTGLVISFQTSINGTAVVGTPIPNDVKVEYTNGSGVVGTPGTVPPEKQPEVWTGGKKFQKIEAGNAAKALAGAVFAVEAVDGGNVTAVKWTAEMIKLNQAAIDAGKFATGSAAPYTATSATNQPTVGSPVLVRAGTDGTFEIQGLQGHEDTSALGGNAPNYDKANSVSRDGTYQLTEVQAPDGYAKLTSSIPFTVTKTTYAAPAAGVEIGTANAAADTNNYFVENKIITIPETGGIGTYIFIGAGLLLMAAAAFGLRRRKSDA